MNSKDGQIYSKHIAPECGIVTRQDVVTEVPYWGTHIATLGFRTDSSFFLKMHLNGIFKTCGAMSALGSTVLSVPGSVCATGHPWFQRNSPLNSIFFRPPAPENSQHLANIIKLIPVPENVFDDNLWWQSLRPDLYRSEEMSLKQGVVLPLDGDCAGKEFALLIFGGNSMDLQDVARLMATFENDVFCRIVVEYPGYGFSQNQNGWRGPNEADTLAAARSAIIWVHRALKYPLSAIVVFGYSIGTGPAVDVAHGVHQAEAQLKMLTLVAPYTSLRDLAREKVGMFAHVVHERFNNIAKIVSVTTPTLYAHGKDDQLIPRHHSEKLMQAQPSFVNKYWRLFNGGHQISAGTMALVRNEMRRFLNDNANMRLLSGESSSVHDVCYSFLFVISYI
jgi:pimeloyl-ACP methyl ester carboxylesterase